MFKGKKVFISGGAGVIGKALVERLHEEGAIIWVGDLQKRPTHWPKEIYYRRGDLNYITQKEISHFSPEVFFHLAATFERSTESYDFWSENFHHNIRLSHHLMSLFKDLESLKRVIFASSYLIYDKQKYLFPTPAQRPVSLDESFSVRPRNLTGAAKLLHEIELDFLSGFPNIGFTSVCARIYRSYGKESRDIISRWIRQLNKGEEIGVFRLEGIFDYIYAGDVAEGLIRLADSDTVGIVNLGTGKSRRVAEVISILKQHFPHLRASEIDSDIPFEASQADMTLFKEKTGWTPSNNLETVIPMLIRTESQTTPPPPERAPHVLISSVSRKIPLIREVYRALNKFGSGGKITGSDSNENAIGASFTDQFWKAPSLKDLTISQLIEFCQKNNINIIIPTRSGELSFFARAKSSLEKAGISTMVSELSAIENTTDKLKFSQVLKTAGFPVIPSFENLDDLKECNQLVVKERYGAGSLSIGINLSEVEARNFSKKLVAPVFQPFIQGIEYSIDVYIDKFGRAKGGITRSRDLVVSGESQITTVVERPQLVTVCLKAAEALKLRGHVVFQAILDENENPHLIECNPRFGGASSLSVNAGLDSFYWFILESTGNDISNYPFIQSRAGLRQIRFPEDKLIET